ncbi:hypothetical protein [Chryseobacterium polytrichastri]|uniref:Lipoprotein n=1 Tax=Chryseobacterium polytrichastri TaxID=1302687 RepID=A0A1M6R5X9_9FLAO|nr:hypothetical protein [Chryseobacterium polytrichastri]SHK27758.1 hypothetical protein SAMN05444267_1002186 [Chryseobacterium polytrichastri]
MKLRIKHLLLIFPLLLVFSCEHLDEIERNKQQENITSPYMGKWSGSYSGDQSGTLILNVGKSGTIEGIKTSQGQQETFYSGLIGSSINSAATSGSGFILYGNLQSKSGTWKMGSLNGTWSVTKN